LDVFLADASANTSYTGNGTSGALFWGAMVNPGGVEAYQRITDFTSDFLAAFPTHALYQDAAGTTPVTVLGQPVGLALDKSRGALANIGPSRIANGAVGLTGTATPATYSTTTGVGTAVRVDPSNQSFVQFSGLTANGMFLITVQNTGAVAFTLRTGSDSGAIFATVAAGTTARVLGQANAFGFLALVPSTGAIAFTVLGFNEVPGVHAIQPTSASRPALDARVNLLTYSEQFDNAAWTKTRSSITANAALAPDGTTTADKLVEDNSATSTHFISRSSGTPIGASTAYEGWVYCKAAERTNVQVRLTVGGTNYGVDVNLSTGAISAISGEVPSAFSALDVGNGWYFVRVRGTSGATTSADLIARLCSAPGVNSYTGDGTSGALIWGADLRLATDAAYPYQRVTTATDYADVGVPRSFLHDGFDDSSYTASSLDLSGTDKVTVWAGVYKNSDAARQMVLELSNGTGTIFNLQAPTALLGDIQFLSQQTAARAANTALAAPASRVATGTADISAPSVALRLNGIQVAQDTGSQGTGNYANAVLNIGRRNNTNLPFNGKIYTIIIRGGVTDAATLALTERYVGSRMGIVL
jgi:hypothetical protein